MKVCECCGHPLPDLEVVEFLTKQQTTILIALKRAGRKGLTMPQMISELHAHNPNGGPEFAETSINVQLAKMRRLLAPYKLAVSVQRNGVRRLDVV
jgi:hypothetical protein